MRIIIPTATGFLPWFTQAQWVCTMQALPSRFMQYGVGSILLSICVCKFYKAADYMVAALCSYTPIFSEYSACKCTVIVDMRK